MRTSNESKHATKQKFDLVAKDESAGVWREMDDHRHCFLVTRASEAFFGCRSVFVVVLAQTCSVVHTVDGRTELGEGLMKRKHAG